MVVVPVVVEVLRAGIGMTINFPGHVSDTAPHEPRILYKFYFGCLLICIASKIECDVYALIKPHCLCAVILTSSVALRMSLLFSILK